MKPQADPELWRRIEGFAFDPPGTVLTFPRRLARENGWSLAQARRAVFEYRRFLYLAMTAGHPVTPSDAVDQVWHLHLTYSRSYWESLCRDTLGRPLHHEPTRGGRAEGDKFEDWYGRTRAAYEATFGERPDPGLWPPSSVRFGTDLAHERVNRDRAWIVSKPKWSGLPGAGTRLAALAGVLVFGTGCTALYQGFPFSLGGDRFLVFFPALAAVAFLVAAALRWFLRGPAGAGHGTDVGDPDPHLVAMLAGGHARAVQSAIVALAAKGSLEVNRIDRTLVAGPAPEAGAHPLEKAVHACLDPVEGQTLRSLVIATRGLGEILRENLENRRWVLTRGGVATATWVPLGVALLVPLVGVVRSWQGMATDHASGFIIVMALAALGVAGFGFGRPARRTRLGEAVLRGLRRRHRELRERRKLGVGGSALLPLAVGLFGSSVLADTPLERLRRTLQPADQATSGCGTSAGCSTGGAGSAGGGDGGGDGGGSGGCGGCGGD